MNRAEAAAPPLSSRQSAVRGYGAAPPGSRVDAAGRATGSAEATPGGPITGKTGSEVVPSTWQPTNCARVHQPTSRRGIRMSPKRSRGRLTAVPYHLAAVDRRFGAQNPQAAALRNPLLRRDPRLAARTLLD